MSVGGQAVAIVLGRAGSKGVPGKNTRPVGGKPCVQWTIDAALAARSVGAVCVSSDDPAMLQLARDSGCIGVERPVELAGDQARVDAAARHALIALESRGTVFGPLAPIVMLYANVPVRPEGLIDRALDVMARTSCDSVQSYAPVGKMHPWWTARVDADDGRVRAWQGDVLNHGVFRRQDLPPAFVPDGGVLVVTRAALMQEIPEVPDGPHAFFGSDRRGVITGEGEVVDIDSEIDVIVADTVLRRRHEPGDARKEVGP